MVHVWLPREGVQFPPVSQADQSGLLMLGGSLAPDWLAAAYRRGVFPWPIETEFGPVLAWFSPDPRAILEPGAMHVSRRLRRRLRSGCFRVSFNEAFADVISGCAAPRRREDGTWITTELAAAYLRIHELGMAHSVEVWQEDQLVGGVYGVALGGFFSGESMFHRTRDASKIALVALVERLQQRGFRLFDIQQWTPHMASLGAVEIPRRAYLQRLAAALEVATTFA